MDADLKWGVLEEPPLEVAEALATGLFLEVVSGPPLEVVVGPMMEEATTVELELDLEVG